MSFYVDQEQQVWKCLKHPSKRQKKGICPTCLRERLRSLCPECSNSHPCSCYATTQQTIPMSILIENEPVFQKSRSLTVPILPSRSKHVGDRYGRELVEVDKKQNVIRSKINYYFWSVFKASKTKKCGLNDDESNRSEDYYSRMMRSRSVAVDAGDGFSATTTTKHRGWYIPSPMKAFRQSKTSKLHMHERSPIHRG